MTDGYCYGCGITDEELEAAGRGLYVCESDECTNECCSDCSESGPSDMVLCLDCWDKP